MDPQLESIIDQIKAVAGMPEDAAEAIAPVIAKDLERTINAHTTPDGEPWQLKENGKPALVDAEQAVSVTAYKGKVYVRITGPEARHHKGNVKGGVRRKIIPDSGKVPPRMAAGITATLNKMFKERTDG